MPKVTRTAPLGYIYHTLKQGAITVQDIFKGEEDYEKYIEIVRSYNVYAFWRKDSLIDEHPIYKELSTNETTRRKRYGEFVKGMIKVRNAMKGEMDRRMIYGNRNFTDVIKKKYELEALIKPKGRPKKEEEQEQKSVPNKSILLQNVLLRQGSLAYLTG